MPHIILLGTLDSKLHEFLYLHQQLKNLAASLNISPLKITLIDCGRTPTQHSAITINQQDLVAKYGPERSHSLDEMPRGEVIKYMITCATSCVKDLIQNEEVHGILSAGGSGGTSLVSAVMRDAAPMGMPKLIVSTVASGDTGPIVGEADITLMGSIVDIAGTNELLRTVLGNAAGAMLGMSTAYEQTLARRRQETTKKAGKKIQIGITMFGVTTICVNKITQHLTENYPVEVYVFHATGHGGMGMERLIEDGTLDAILDITTTEICDYLFGGNMRAGPRRLEGALRKKIPNIISVGATDMVNFGPKSTVPGKYKDRLFLEHNPMVTLMRTTSEECVKVGEFIVDKIKNFVQDPEMVEVWTVRKGVSILSTPGGIFENLDADNALAETLKGGLKGTGIKIVEDVRHVNDEGFAVDIAERLMQLVNKKYPESGLTE